MYIYAKIGFLRDGKQGTIHRERQLCDKYNVIVFPVMEFSNTVHLMDVNEVSNIEIILAMNIRLLF